MPSNKVKFLIFSAVLIPSIVFAPSILPHLPRPYGYRIANSIPSRNENHALPDYLSTNFGTPPYVPYKNDVPDFNGEYREINNDWCTNLISSGTPDEDLRFKEQKSGQVTFAILDVTNKEYRASFDKSLYRNYLSLMEYYKTLDLKTVELPPKNIKFDTTPQFPAISKKITIGSDGKPNFSFDTFREYCSNYLKIDFSKYTVVKWTDPHYNLTPKFSIFKDDQNKKITVIVSGTPEPNLSGEGSYGYFSILVEKFPDNYTLDYKFENDNIPRVFLILVWVVGTIFFIVRALVSRKKPVN